MLFPPFFRLGLRPGLLVGCTGGAALGRIRVKLDADVLFVEGPHAVGQGIDKHHSEDPPEKQVADIPGVLLRCDGDLLGYISLFRESDIVILLLKISVASFQNGGVRDLGLDDAFSGGDVGDLTFRAVRLP